MVVVLAVATVLNTPQRKAVSFEAIAVVLALEAFTETWTVEFLLPPFYRISVGQTATVGL